MILQTLEVENFGIYSGIHRFELSPDPGGNRPIVLITGQNGGGKSTFFEAIRLVFYGKRCLGIRIAQSQYDAYLLEKIHLGATKRFARLRLDFTRIEEGHSRNYQIVRAWAARGKSVVESFDLKRDGSIVLDLAPEEWQNHIEDLVPPGVSQLFFFDGEKIEEFADNESNTGIRNSIHMLFGLDLIEQLRTDLSHYAARKDNKGVDVSFEALETERADLDEAVRVAEEDRAETNSRRDQVLGRVRRAETRFKSEGGRFATDREQLQMFLNENLRERERLLLLLKAFAGSALPLSIAPALIEELQLIVDKVRLQSSPEAITAFINAFESRIPAAKSSGNTWTNTHLDTLRRFASQEYSNSACSTGAEPALDADPAFISNRLSQLTTLSRAEAAKLAEDLDQNSKERTILEQQLEGFDLGLASDALDELKAAIRRLGAVEAQLDQQDRVIQDLRNRRVALDSEWSRSQKAIIRKARGKRSRDIAARAAAALIEYEEQLLEARILSIKLHFRECFSNLIRKQNLVKSIAFDKCTFDITLVGVDGNRIPHEALSAGERQIFAISMIWALAKTSGCTFPVLIDTPLSRLDKRHRQAFIESYVTTASHQVILLCTDTEMTPDLEESLKPHISSSYHLSVAVGSNYTKSMPLNAHRETSVAHVHK